VLAVLKLAKGESMDLHGEDITFTGRENDALVAENALSAICENTFSSSQGYPTTAHGVVVILAKKWSIPMSPRLLFVMCTPSMVTEAVCLNVVPWGHSIVAENVMTTS
jgi:hypothetical protein